MVMMIVMMIVMMTVVVMTKVRLDPDAKLKRKSRKC